MRLRGITCVGSGPRNRTAHSDERGALLLIPRSVKGLSQGTNVNVTVGCHADTVDIPAIGRVASHNILGEGNVRVAFDGDVIVVPHNGEIAQPLDAGKGGRFTR